MYLSGVIWFTLSSYYDSKCVCGHCLLFQHNSVKEVAMLTYAHVHLGIDKEFYSQYSLL